MEGDKGTSIVEVAMQYNDNYNELIYTYANNIATHEGGTHLQGFKTALTRVVNDYAKRHHMLKNGEAALSGEDVREGLVAVISVKLEEPQFEGQTKTKLGNSEFRSLVDNVVGNALDAFLEEHPDEARAIIDKCLTANRAREAAARRESLHAARTCLNPTRCPANWPTARITIRKTAKYS